MSDVVEAVPVEIPIAENAVPYDKNDTLCCRENVELRTLIGRYDEELLKQQNTKNNLERQLENYKKALVTTARENNNSASENTSTTGNVSIKDRTNRLGRYTNRLGRYTNRLFKGVKNIGGSKRKTLSKSKGKNKTRSKGKTPSKSKGKSKSKSKTRSKKEESEMIFFYDMDELKKLVAKHKVGSILEYNTENQMGTLIYKIIKKSGKKDVEIIGDYYGLYNLSPTPSLSPI